MNKRQTEILRILYKNRSFITIGDIARQTDVSPKTVRNDLSVIKQALINAHAGTIEARPHIGVRLISSEEEIKNLQNIREDEDREIFFFIIRQLFKNDTLTAQKLSGQYYLGRTQTEKILSQTENWFKDNNIIFERRRGKGITIRYSEFNYRMALLDFYTDYRDLYFELITERDILYPVITGRDYTSICAALNGFDIVPIVKAVAELEKEFGFKLNYLSGIRLIFMLALGITRIKKGIIIEMPDAKKCPVEDEWDEKISKFISAKLEEYTGIIFPPQELKYIEFAASVSEIQEFDTEETRHAAEVLNTKLCRFTVKTVNLISEITEVNLRNDKFFVRNMFLQLKVTIARLRYGICLKNGLLSEIKEKYPNMMAVAWILGNVFEKELTLEINENEVGYIALHTGGAVERHLDELCACIVCNYGVGISGILREKIRRAIPDLRILGIYSARDIRKLKSREYDFIISTVPLEDYRLNADVVKVSHLLDEKDIKNIEERMKKIHLSRKETIKNIRADTKLFNRDLIFPKVKAKSKNEVLKILCSRLEIMGYVTDGFEKSVFDRENSASTGIGKGIAIPHGLSKYVNRSVFAYASLEKPIEWNSEGEMIDIIFLLAFDLDGDKYVKDEIIGFYKSVVAFMEDGEKCSRLKELEDKNEIFETFNLW